MIDKKPKITMAPTPIDSKWAWVPDYLTPVYDKRGHYEHVNYKVPPGTQHELAMAIKAHEELTGWSTPSDFVRWCIRLGLAYCTMKFKDPEFSNVNLRQTVILRTLAAAHELQRFEEIWKETEETIKRWVENGDDAEARSLCLKVKADIDGMEEGRHKRQWQKRMHEKFGHLLRGASLKSFNTGEDDEG